MGLSACKEYRHEELSIRYFPSSGHLDVWRKRKVLTVNRRKGKQAAAS